MPRGYPTPEEQRLDVLKRLHAGRTYQRVSEETGMPRATITTIAAIARLQGKLKPRAVGRPKIK